MERWFVGEEMTTKPRTSKGSGAKAKDGATMATTKQICARIWIRQGAAYKALGGSEWLRAMIDRETQQNASLSGLPREGD